MNDAMDSANGKLDLPIYYGELGCPKNPKRKYFYEILQHWTQILKQNNLEYILAYGSLLGAMRDGDIIPYDSDIDVLVDHNYFSILKKACSKDIYFLKENLLHAIFYLRYVKLLVVTKCSLYTLSSPVHTGNIEHIRPVVAYKRLKTIEYIFKEMFLQKVVVVAYKRS